MVAPAAKPAIVSVTVSSPSTPLAVIDGNVTVLPSATVAVVLPNVSTGVSAAGFTVTAIVCAAPMTRSLQRSYCWPSPSA